MRKLLRGHALIERANELDVYIYAAHEQVPLGTNPYMGAIAPESEIQVRVMAAEKHLREQRLWIFALISAIASAVSAIAAWCAVVLK
jgi:hypothetical protein